MKFDHVHAIKVAISAAVIVVLVVVLSKFAMQKLKADNVLVDNVFTKMTASHYDMLMYIVPVVLVLVFTSETAVQFVPMQMPMM